MLGRAVIPPRMVPFLLEQIMESKFWMVYRVESTNGPKMKHDTLGAAIQEANRMAAVMTGTYLILEAVGKVTAKVGKMDVEMSGYSDPTEG